MCALPFEFKLPWLNSFAVHQISMKEIAAIAKPEVNQKLSNISVNFLYFAHRKYNDNVIFFNFSSSILMVQIWNFT